MASFFHTACPQCGANIEVQSATAVTVVCGHCHSMLVRDGEQLGHTGRHSALLQDFTPLQIGSNGSWNGLLFTLVGRLQVQYEGGSWNEWHALLQDGSSAWLSEASDGFVFTQQEQTPQIGNLPDFDDIEVGTTFFGYGPHQYAVSDIRVAKRSRYAAQGELPYLVPENQEARVVDCRSTDAFMTLDYTDDVRRPEVFSGTGVRLGELRLNHLRDSHQIQQSAGKLKGQSQSNPCPNCGGPVQWVAGMASQVVCAYCQSQLDFSDDEVKLVQMRNVRIAQDENLTLALGAEARILNQKWWVLGVMKQSEVNGLEAHRAIRSHSQKVLVPEGDAWFEYLLYAPEQGFLWLTEMVGNRWSIAKTLDAWPALQAPLQPVDGNKRPVPKLYDYGGQVQFAAGAFYWQVAPQDITYYTDFGSERQKLSTSLTAFEQSWSAVSEVPAAAVATWFDNQAIAKKPLDTIAANEIVKKALAVNAQDFSGGAAAKAVSAGGSNRAMVWLMIYLFVNLPAMLIGLVGEGLLGVIVVTFIVHWLLKFIFNKEI